MSSGKFLRNQKTSINRTTKKIKRRFSFMVLKRTKLRSF